MCLGTVNRFRRRMMPVGKAKSLPLDEVISIFLKGIFFIRE